MTARVKPQVFRDPNADPRTPWCFEAEIGGGVEWSHYATWFGAQRGAGLLAEHLRQPPRQKLNWCGNESCPCARPSGVCDEWMGELGMTFCPRCGWNRSGHVWAAEHRPPQRMELAA